MTRLGGSFDWDRVAFTLNDVRGRHSCSLYPAEEQTLSKAVRETFCLMHEKGLLYRANRLVNWCVYLNTSLSNLEVSFQASVAHLTARVDQIHLAGRTLMNVKGYDAKERFEFGVITSFAYPIEHSGKWQCNFSEPSQSPDERIIIATTRPETMLGDTAIAVHPDDSRYKVSDCRPRSGLIPQHLHGKYALHPFIPRRIPIITDAITVDMEFGTGAVKITPAHDPNDFECGVRNKLEFYLNNERRRHI